MFGLEAEDKELLSEYATDNAGKHVFVMKDMTELHETFDEMIGMASCSAWANPVWINSSLCCSKSSSAGGGEKNMEIWYNVLNSDSAAYNVNKWGTDAHIHFHFSVRYSHYVVSNFLVVFPVDHFRF